MRKICIAVLALAIMAICFTGCRKNVSDREDGTITESTAMTEPSVTMPSTDTTPAITTEPSFQSDSTETTDETGTSESETTQDGMSGGDMERSRSRKGNSGNRNKIN